MSSSKEVLSQLFAEGTLTLPVLGRKVIIKKVTLRTMKPILDMIARVVADLTEAGVDMNSVSFSDPSFILKLISKYYDEAIELVVKLTDVGQDEILDMDPDESVLVVQSVIELNRNFFTTKVLPNLQLAREVETAD